MLTQKTIQQAVKRIVQTAQPNKVIFCSVLMRAAILRPIQILT